MNETETPSHILVVDDTLRNIQVAGSALQSRGHRISFATRGEQALDLALRNPYDLVLLDVMMPEMDGFEVCRRLKAVPRTRDVPVVFLTARTESDAIVRGFRLGAVDYITKPLHVDELIARVQNQLELHHTRKRLTALNETKDRLISVLSHDLRNSLGAVSMASEMLAANCTPCLRSRQDVTVDLIRQSIGQASSLLDNLIGWTRAQTGLLKPKMEGIPVGNLVVEAVALLRPAAESKQVELCDWPKSESCRVLADRHMLSVVVRNLISNAIKFTPSGGRVSVESACTQTHTTLVVADTGMGIDEDRLAGILVAGNSSPGTAGETGTGLGLLLCAEFTRLQGGEIAIESQVGKGTRVSITFPTHFEPPAPL